MENNSEVVYLYLDDIIPNRFQPREVFDDQALKELAVSIKEHGVIQPIIVRKVGNKYEIIAGERRYKASTMAGLTKIPAIVKNLDDKESSKVALIENLQRRDLTPIEEARTYQKILSLENGMTQEQLAQTMGKTQSVVSNKLRLLALPDEVQDALLQEKISERHARSLLNVSNKNEQIKLLNRIISERMTVRELDKEIKEMNDNVSANGGNSLNLNIDNNVQNADSISNTNMTSINSNNIGLNNQANSIPDINKGVNVPNPLNAVNNSVSTNILNPTVVDIDKIRENSVDIGGSKVESVDVKDLMKDMNAPKIESDFKFIPADGNKANTSLNNNTSNSSSMNSNFSGFGLGNASSTDLQSTFGSFNSNNSSNSFSKLFDVNSSSDSSPVNNSVASSMSMPSINLSGASSGKKDVSGAVNDIKNVVKNIESRGYKVSISESDSDSSYQITINVNKI